MKKILFILIIVLSSNILLAQELKYKLQVDVPYYENKATPEAYKKERCKLDIYYPTNKKDFATVIWFHGGGLTGGEKEIPKALEEKGMAVIGVGYRLSPKTKGSEIIQDAAAAVAWTFKHIREFGGNEQLIFISGHSAGGYLGVMVTLDKHYLQAYDVDANRIAELIPFSGQTITHFTIRKEQGLKETQPTIDQYAPLFHVRADAPPLLLITGDREQELLGRYEENAYMVRMMKLVGHSQTRLIELGGYGHNMTFPAFPLLIKEIDHRTKEILKN
ncbi:alpha/beta hydrolase [Olivibacter domesticus]|uniref:Acetyl esterase/lipase n=1 Tax=Olivibacter domesticus TaxID=407022 RepID=A0A1H7LQS2_OLID1|nr:alpha/beta hydrolase [Olivibacter domesticus]SEL01068.1 Acetyl esterase/lipase [Olivibacter domesticus]